MRNLLILFVTILCGPLSAQLGVGEDVGTAEILHVEQYDLVGTLPWMMDAVHIPLSSGLESSASSPYSFLDVLPEPVPFDFTAAKPYLAFFCRLELDIEAATNFPVRFRLGEVRTWQQELTKRD